MNVFDFERIHFFTYNTKKNNMKDKKLAKGDTIIMYFHAFGVVSEEECIIKKIENNLVYLERDEDSFWVFNNKGICINDENFGGVYRRIKPF